jgi:hypothetical protein
VPRRVERLPLLGSAIRRIERHRLQRARCFVLLSREMRRSDARLANPRWPRRRLWVSPRRQRSDCVRRGRELGCAAAQVRPGGGRGGVHAARCWWPGVGHRSSSGSPTPSCNHAEDRLQDVEPGMGSARGTPPSWHCRATLPPAPEGTPPRQGGGGSQHDDGSEQLEPGQHSGGQPIGFSTDTGRHRTGDQRRCAHQPTRAP